MSLNQDASIVKEFSVLTIECLKKLASRGEKLTPESLYEVLFQMPATKKIFARNDNEAIQSINYDLKEEIKRLSEQKSKLLTELDGLEEKNSANETSYRRMILFFAGYLEKNSVNELETLLKNFKGVLKKRAAVEVVENVFSKIKETSFQTELAGENKAKEKKKSIVPEFFKRASASDVEKKYISEFRLTYQEIIDTLGLDLGEKFLEKLLDIGKRIKTSRTIDEFHELKNDILALLHDYIGNVTTDREKVAEFVKDIGSRLISLEESLIKTFGNTESLYSSGNSFATVIEEELNKISEALTISTTIEELKETLSSKIDSLSITIAEKNKRDAVLKKQSDRDIELLKNEFEAMKTEASAAQEKARLLEKEVLTDPLTGAMNRRAYDKRIKEEFQRFTRYNRGFSMLIFDVDHFKRVNDSYGHSIGDKCLKEIIQRVRPLLRQTDMLARFGGEEFIVILPETQKAGAVDVAEKLRQVVEKIEFIHRKEVVKVTISLGVTEVLETDKTPSDVFGRIDMAMYEAKNSGRNKVITK